MLHFWRVARRPRQRILDELVGRHEGWPSVSERCGFPRHRQRTLHKASVAKLSTSSRATAFSLRRLMHFRGTGCTQFYADC